MSGGGGAQTTTMEPPKFLQPYLMQAADAAAAEFQGGAQPYTGPRFTGPTQSELIGRQEALGQVGGIKDIGRASQTAYQQMMTRPDDILNNPQLREAMLGATAPIQDKLLEKTLPAISNGAAATGNFGGSQMQNLQGQAVREATRAQQDVGSQMLMTAYQKALGQQIGGLQMGGQVQRQQLAAPDIYQQIGSAQRADDEMARLAMESGFREQTGAEAANIQEYINMLLGVGQQGGGTQTTKGGGPSGAQRLGGGLMSGLGTYGALLGTPMAGLAAPIGIGAGLLGLL